MNVDVESMADIFQLLTLSDAGKSVAWRGAAAELTEGLQQVYPDIAFCVKQSGKQLLLSDEEGNEYYFGGNITIKNTVEKNKSIITDTDLFVINSRI